jgi:hypothetical protein
MGMANKPETEPKSKKFIQKPEKISNPPVDSVPTVVSPSLQEIDQDSFVKKVLAIIDNPFVGLVVGIFISIMQIAGVVNMKTAFLLLLLLGSVIVIKASIKEWLLTKSRKRLFNVILLYTAILGCSILLIYEGMVWMVDSKAEQIKPSVASYNQSGGITAGQVNITTDLPPPKVSFELVKKNELRGELYESVYVLTIDSKVPIPKLYVQVDAETIADKLQIMSHNGMTTGGHSGKREGFAFTNILNASGTYSILVITSKAESSNLRYSF